MKLSHFSISRPLATMMIVVGMIFVGFVSLRGLPIDLFPEIDFPLVAVQVVYTGAAPGEVETGITEKLEKALATLEGVENLTAYSREGVSTVVIEFEWGVDLDTKTNDVRDKVERIKTTFPDDAEEPTVSKFDIMSAETVLLFAVSRNLTAEERRRYETDTAFRDDVAYLTRKFVEDEVQPEIERIAGVAATSLSGGREREILVSVDMYKLKAKGVTLDDVELALDLENVEKPGGRLDERRTEFSTRFLGRYEDVGEIEHIEVAKVNGKPVYLREVATVEDTYKEQRDYARMNGADAVLVDVIKESGENSAAIADKIYPRLDELRAKFPGYDFAMALDLTDFLRASIGMVESNAAIGGVIALLVLLLFLRDLRSVIIAGIAIPTAIITTFTLIKAANLTLNLLSLGGLALGVGMLVDNSIVMLENITRRISISRDAIKGAREGAAEVGGAISASTYTTMAVFLPVLFFVSGVPSQIFDDLSLTVAFALACSLLVALTFVPMACSRMLRVKPGQILDLEDNPEAVSENRFIRRLRTVLQVILHRRGAVVGVVVAIFALALVIFMTRGMIFFPPFDRGEFAVTLEMPVDASLEATETATRTLEKIVEKNVPSLKHYSMSVEPQSASLTVTLRDDRKLSTFRTRQLLRELVNVIPGGRVSVADIERRGGGGGDIEILLRGPTNVAVEPLRAVGDNIEAIADRTEGAINVKNQLKAGRREIQIKPLRPSVSNLALNYDRIARTISTLITGKVPTTYREEGDEYDVRLKLENAQDLDPEQIAQLLIPLPGTGNTVALEEVAAVQYGLGPVELQREDQRRVARITADVEEGAVLSEVVRKISDTIDEKGLPEGYTYDVGGEEEDRREAMQQLTFALFVSIALVYMILVTQFESLVFPLIIIQTIPLCLVGVALALLVTFRPINLMVMLGLIMLAGIVVNNAIVLVDFINTLRRRGYERHEAVVLGTQVRFRPIVMTTLTTIGGMSPLALGLGSGSELYQSMAITVIGGLLVSTFFTLLYIPVMYLILDDLSVWSKKRLVALEHAIEEGFRRLFRRLFRRGRSVAD